MHVSIPRRPAGGNSKASQYFWKETGVSEEKKEGHPLV
jgi:hypothetical protein